MSRQHKGATEATGLVALLPQLAAALLHRNRHRQAPESSHPRERFPRQRHPPALRQQDVSKGALRAVEQQWLLLPFARPTVTLEHTVGATGTVGAMATIVAALVIMTTAGAGAALEPEWQLGQLLHH